MKTARKVSENTVWQVASKVTNAVTGIVILGAIQRLYGSEGVGIYSTIIAYTSFYFMPVDFGLNALAVKHLLDKERNPSKVFANVLGFRLCLSAVVTITAILIALALPYNNSTGIGYSDQIKIGILIAAVSIVAQALLSSANAYFQAIEKYIYSFSANAVSAALNVCIFLFLLKGGAPIQYAVAALSISGILGGITALWLVKNKQGTLRIMLDITYLKNLIKDTLPLTISLVLNLVYFRIDALILPFYRPLEEVGKYNIAYKIFDTLLVIPNYFSNALYPVLLKTYAENTKKFFETIKKSAITLGVLAILATAISYILAPVGVLVVTGSQDYQTIEYTRVLTSGLILFFLSSIAMWTLIVVGKQKYLAYIYGTTMVINITLNATLIPVYGATASAITTLITEAIVLLLSATLVYKHLNQSKQS